MMFSFAWEDFDSTAIEAATLDLSRLLGFRDLAGVGCGEAEVAAALDAVHVKIGET